MRTSEEIYHRVRWDARFDPARFVLGVAQRGREPKRVPLDRFTPGGDIPWHRVLFFEADGEVVWDRATGTDRIDATDSRPDTGGAPPAVPLLHGPRPARVRPGDGRVGTGAGSLSDALRAR